MNQTALIVEDEIFVALDLERILEDAGYHVVAIAADAETALEAAPGCRFAFVDVNLRDGATGPAIAERIARDYGVKVVFVTANPGQITNRDAALGYVRKPFNEEAILAAAHIATQADGISVTGNLDFVQWSTTPMTGNDGAVPAA